MSVCVSNHCAVYLKLIHCRSTILQLLKKSKNGQKFADTYLIKGLCLKYAKSTYNLNRDLPNPGIKPGSPALQVDSLPSELPGKL